MPGPRLLGSFAYQEAAIFGIASIVAFALALVFRLAQGHLDGGVFLSWQTFTILGLLLLAVHMMAPGWPRRAA